MANSLRLGASCQVGILDYFHHPQVKAQGLTRALEN